MIGSAVFMLALGVLLTFAPQEVLAYGGSKAQPAGVLAVQAGGALYLGFAMLNWMAKDSLIGGIYSRPVAMGNLLHFFAMSAALLKAVAGAHREPVLAGLAVVYTLFAVWFLRVTFGSPARVGAESGRNDVGGLGQG